MQTNIGYTSMRMNKVQASIHAAKRCAHRGISADALTLIRAFGQRGHDGKGGVRYVMTRRSMEKLYRAAGRTSLTEALEGCYVVVDAPAEETAITVGHRH